MWDVYLCLPGHCSVVVIMFRAVECRDLEYCKEVAKVDERECYKVAGKP